MKVLFINPPYTSLAGIAESAGHMMPLCFGYLAAYARERLPRVEFKILDCEAENVNFEGIQRTIAAFSPQVVGLTVPTPTLNYAYRIADETKSAFPDTTLVFGGIHPSVMPERTMADNSSVDIVVIGEGEETFHQLLLELEKPVPDFGRIDGVAFRDGENVVVNPPGELIADLDIIPFPARDLFNLEYYRSAPTKKVSNEDATPILTSRGCAYNCIHCPSKTIWCGKVRYRSTQNVVDEIEHCTRRFELGEFNFFDDTFTLNRKRALEVCEEIIRRKLDIYWICFSRTNTINEELVNKMKEAGCRKISFGLESGNQQILDTMRKKTTLQKGRDAVKIVRDAGIPVHTNTTVSRYNLPHLKEIARFVKEMGLSRLSMNLCIPCGAAVKKPYLWVSYEEIGDHIKGVKHFADNKGLYFMWYSPVPVCMFNPIAHGLGNKSCAAITGLLSIDPQGNIIPCSSWRMPVASLLRRPFQDIWESEFLAYFKNRDYAPEQCRNCVDLDLCKGACPLYWQTCGQKELDGRP